MTELESRSPVRTLIVDDEPLARAHLRSLLRERGDVDVIGECGDGRSAIDQIKRLGPELVLLDIQTVSYTHLTLPTIERCRSRWSPYH